MADDRLIVTAELKFDKQPFKPFESAVKRTERFVSKLESRTKKLQVTSQKTGKKLNKMLDDYTNRAKKADTASGRLVKKIGALAGAYLTVSKTMESINLASTMVETQTKMNVVFGKMADDANNWAEEYANSMGFSVLKTKEGMGDIQNLFTGFGIARKESFDLSKTIVTLANDLDSFNNLSSRGVDVQKTMISALMGETEAAKTLGASILETQLNVASQTMGLGEYNNKWDEATKIQVRLRAIMDQSKDAIGDVSRNLDTEVGVRRRLNAQIQNTQIALGQKLMPLWMQTLDVSLRLTTAIQNNINKFDGLVNAIQGAFNIGSKFFELMTSTTSAAKTFQGAIATITGLLVTYKAVAGAVFLIEKARTAYTALVAIPTIFKSNVAIIANTTLLIAQKTALVAGFVATKLFTAAQWALNIALNANPVGLIITGIAALTAGFVLAYKKIEPFRILIDKLWATMKKFGTKALGMIFKTENKDTTRTENVSEFASGTSNAPGGMAVVGERGPELVNLPKGSSVMNNTNTMNKIGGSSVSVGGDSISISISGAGDPQSIWEQIKPQLEQHERRKRDRLVAVLR